jgi:hypothetical protein
MRDKQLQDIPNRKKLDNSSQNIQFAYEKHHEGQAV